MKRNFLSREKITTNNFYHKNICFNGILQINVDPPLTPLLKNKLDLNTERDYEKNKLGRESISEKLGMYEFKMAVFQNGDLEKFILFVQNFKVILEASVTLTEDLKLQ